MLLLDFIVDVHHPVLGANFQQQFDLLMDICHETPHYRPTSSNMGLNFTTVYLLATILREISFLTHPQTWWENKHKVFHYIAHTYPHRLGS